MRIVLAVPGLSPDPAVIPFLPSAHFPGLDAAVRVGVFRPRQRTIAELIAGYFVSGSLAAQCAASILERDGDGDGAGKIGGAAQGGLFLAAPFSARVDLSSALVVTGESVGLSLGEAQSCAQALNEFFEPEGLAFFPASASLWLAKSAKPLGFSGPAAWDCEGRVEGLERFGPDGPTVMRWEAEAQMFLRGHPFNARRAKAGKNALNGALMWKDTVGNAEFERTLLASRPSFLPLPDAARALPRFEPDLAAVAGLLDGQGERPERIVFWDGSVAQAARMGDPDLWHEAVGRFDAEVLSPLLRRMAEAGGGVDGVDVVDETGALAIPKRPSPLRRVFGKHKKYGGRLA